MLEKASSARLRESEREEEGERERVRFASWLFLFQASIKSRWKRLTESESQERVVGNLGLVLGLLGSVSTLQNLVERKKFGKVTFFLVSVSYTHLTLPTKRIV